MTIPEQLRELLADATPGDWYVTPYECSNGITTRENGKYAHRVAETCQWTPARLGQPDMDVAAANAALIVFLRNNAPHFATLEDKNVRLRESLSWALSKVSQPRLVVGQNEKHCAAYHAARAALQEQPK